MKQIFMHNLSGNFCNLLLFLLSKHQYCWAGCLGKSCTLVQWGYTALHCVHDVFVPVFECHALKPQAPIDKQCNFFLAPDFINSMISQYSALKMCVRKFCMRYILKEQFWLNISRVISKSVGRGFSFFPGGGGGGVLRFGSDGVCRWSRQTNTYL